VNHQRGPDLLLRLPPLDGATAAWLLDLCAHVQTALWHDYGDDIEAHWLATEPDQPIYGGMPRPPRSPKKR
jgi:hypothetical protein